MSVFREELEIWYIKLQKSIERMESIDRDNDKLYNSVVEQIQIQGQITEPLDHLMELIHDKLHHIQDFFQASLGLFSVFSFLQRISHTPCSQLISSRRLMLFHFVKEHINQLISFSYTMQYI
ncbi:MAG: hypothetical protein Sylvanvirus11_6 [Sylvanvirus sp.]|uniref:Uncharacterized protein n=1 Tax=Sylvanvirus sp. TaxID=2487774 RepID=A0A3G5AKL1_9VIRU|nr:MAG: hypothetical protein Sylvanvirus11_6 [Sylvanvirus sp.]